MNAAAPLPLLMVMLMVSAGFCTAKPRPNIFSYVKGLLYSGDSKEATTTTTLEPPVPRANLDRDDLDAAMLKMALPAHRHAAEDDDDDDDDEVVHSHRQAADQEGVRGSPHVHVHRALPVHVSELHYG